MVVFLIKDLESLMTFGSLSEEEVSRITTLRIENYDDIKEGDILEAFTKVRV